MSKAESITAAVYQALLNQTSAGANVHRHDVVEERGTVPAVYIIKARETKAVESPISLYRWELEIVIKMVARGATPDQAVDQLNGEVHAKLYADRSLGGTAMDIMVGDAQYSQDPESPASCILTRSYYALYETLETAL